MIYYWIQEATQAGAQGAASSWPSAILSGGIVGAVVGLIGVLITQVLTQLRHSKDLELTERTVHLTLETQRANIAAELEAQRAHEVALQKYFEQVGKLLIEQPLRDANPDDNLSTVARAQTLAVLEGLDPDRKRILLQFVWEANLVKVDKPIIRLWGANLSEANLSETNLFKVDLTEANLQKANLDGVSLEGARLYKACLEGAYLRKAKNLAQEQLDQANGDKYTQLPDHLQRPPHWR